MKKVVSSLLFLFGVVIFSGCYTQFVMVDKTPPPQETVGWAIDSTTGDSVKVVKQLDTIRVQDRQTCVWERDLMGYPVLRCYNSMYANDWFWYNNSPWWYRNDPYWYDYQRCPRGYYFDQSCGRCQYTGSNYYYNRNHGSSSEDRGNQNSGIVPPGGGSTIYPRTQGIPNGTISPVPSSGSNTSNRSKSGSAVSSGRQSGQLIIPSPAESVPPPGRQRDLGIPGGSSTAAPVAPPPPPATTATAPAPVSAPPPPPPASTGTSSTNSNPPPAEQNHQTERQNPRSW